MKHLFVINPHSFRRPEGLKQIIMDIENAFSSGPGTNSKTDHMIYISRYPRDAIPAVHRYILNCPADEIARVYAVGGDGILFDCLNGMVDFPNAELTSVPYGNDNDFIRAFGENVYDRFRNIKELAASPSRPVDIIHCGSNYALLETHIGFVGHSIILANEMFRRVPEKLLRNNVNIAYLLCVIKSMFNREIMQQRYTVFVDGEDLSGSYCNMHIASSACTGGTMVLSPYAKVDKGSLEVILVNTNRKRDIIRIMGDYTRGHFEKHDIFIHRQCREIEVKSDNVMSVQIDGEAFHAKELTLKIIPKGVNFFAPEDLNIIDYSSRAYKNEGKNGNADNK